MKRDYIKKIFEKFGNDRFEIYFSGFNGIGECKSWWDNGKLQSHGWYKHRQLEGEVKVWDDEGQINNQYWCKSGKGIDFPKDV